MVLIAMHQSCIKMLVPLLRPSSHADSHTFQLEEMKTLLEVNASSIYIHNEYILHINPLWL